MLYKPYKGLNIYNVYKRWSTLLPLLYHHLQNWTIDLLLNPLGPHVADLLQKFVRTGTGVSVYHLMWKMSVAAYLLLAFNHVIAVYTFCWVIKANINTQVLLSQNGAMSEKWLWTWLFLYIFMNVKIWVKSFFWSKMD